MTFSFYSGKPLSFEVICDACLTVMRVKHFRSKFSTECPCGRRLWDTGEADVIVPNSNRVLASTFMRPYDGSYSGITGEARLMIEHRTGIWIESDEDVRLFLATVGAYDTSIEKLERVGTRLLEMYELFSRGGPGTLPAQLAPDQRRLPQGDILTRAVKIVTDA